MPFAATPGPGSFSLQSLPPSQCDFFLRLGSARDGYPGGGERVSYDYDGVSATELRGLVGGL
jgi:hypothetical protein